MSRFLDQKYKKLNVYVPGEQPQDKAYIKLNTNESPYPPSQLVIDSVSGKEMSDLRLYSDPECKVLKDKIACRYGVKASNVYLSNGSDDILNFAFMAYCSDGRPVAFADITYGFYKVFAELYNSKCNVIPLEADFTLDHKKYCGLNQTIFIANPNAPTGIALSISKIEEILVTNPDNVVIIDEAYVDFGAESVLPLLNKYDNLLIVRTYSKSRSMAGARLGFAFASDEIISDLEKIKYSTNPYNVNRLTQIAGAAAIDSDSYFEENCMKIVATRDWTVDQLINLGFNVIPSKANFIFAEHSKISGAELYLKLKDRGVLVRHFDSNRISNFNRITVGSEPEMRKFIEITKEILLGD